MTTSEQNSKGINISLWATQGLLGAMYLMAGVMKLTTPVAELAAKMAWVNEYSEAFIRFIGISEVLGALGLILPSLLRIQPKLTVWAAMGLALVQVFAILLHIELNEFNMLGVNVVLLLLAVFVAWGRSKKAPISAK
jgi:hypothetical protein